MRLLVCGGFDLPEAKIRRMIGVIFPTPKAIILPGPNNPAAIAWAEENGAEVEIHQPDLVVSAGLPSMVLAFPGDDGTTAIVELARAAGIMVMCAF